MNNNLRKCVDNYCNAIHEHGYSSKRVAADSAILKKLILAHELQSSTDYSSEITKKYVEDIRELLSHDKIGRYFAQQQFVTISKFQFFIETGQISTERLHLPKIPLNAAYDFAIEEYISSVAVNSQQKKSRAWAPKRYAGWLLNHGVNDFANATIYDLRQYMSDDMKNLKSKTIPTLRSEMRRFQRWLHENGHADGHYEELFDFKIAIENKIHPAAFPDDVAKVLTMVDRGTDIGKRDYAVFMTGIVLGLRGCDIIKLKLTDIDWRQGELRITQSKTGKALALPLTTDVAEVLKDYILNGRPKCENDSVFIRHTPPFLPYTRSGILSRAYTAYMKKAGVEGEGGLYPLRRALGKNMVIAETPVTTVAQVLGHVDISNTKQYISLDTVHLKICALNLEGIMPGRWL